MKSFAAPRPLEPSDLVEGFECASTEQSLWLREHAKQAHSGGIARVFVVTEAHSKVVVAYYAWAMVSITLEAVPERMKRGSGRYPQPAALLARLGVSSAYERRGLGAGLMQDVISRAAELSVEIGMRALIIHCETAEARTFYQHLIPELEESPTVPNHLLLLTKDLLKTIL